jgi:Transposase DDE domain
VVGIGLYIAVELVKHKKVIETVSGPPPPPNEEAAKEAMQHKRRTEAGNANQKMIYAILEPVIGQSKERRNFLRFRLRGYDKVCAEWKLMCATSNLLKLFRCGWTTKISRRAGEKPFSSPRRLHNSISRRYRIGTTRLDRLPAINPMPILIPALRNFRNGNAIPDRLLASYQARCLLLLGAEISLRIRGNDPDRTLHGGL